MDNTYREFLRMQGSLRELESSVRFPNILLAIVILVLPFSRLIRLLKNSDVNTRKVGTLELVLGKKHLEISEKLKLDSVKILLNSDEKLYLESIDEYSDNALIKYIPLVSCEVLRKFKDLGSKNWKKYCLRILKQAVLDDLIWKKYACDIFVIYNDHTPYCLSAADYFKKQGSKVIYVQHAPVGSHFPPLRWDLSLLYSQRYLDVYRKIADSRGVAFDETKIRVIGDIRLKALKPAQKERNGISRILIAYNLLDSLSAVDCLAETLSNLGYDILLRPHPLDKRKTRFSLENSSSLLNDLSLCDALICNESGILLEALYCGMYVYKASFLSRSFDNYGFMALGLLKKEYNSSELLLEGIRREEITFDKSLVKYFTGDLEDSKNFNEIINEVFG